MLTSDVDVLHFEGKVLSFMDRFITLARWIGEGYWLE